MFLVTLYIFVGLLAEFIVRRFLKKQYFSNRNVGDLEDAGPVAHGNFDKFTATLVSTVPEVIGLLFFFGASYFSYVTFIWTNSSLLQLFFLAILLAITIIRVISIFSRLIFSPNSSALRILSIKSDQAVILYFFFVLTGGYLVTALMVSTIIFRLGASPETVIILVIVFATILILASGLAVIKYKEAMKNAILKAAEGPPSWTRERFASLWHLLALLYLTSLWLLLIHTGDTDGVEGSRSAFLISFFILPIWMLSDRFIQWIVKFLMATLKIYEEKDIHENMNEEEQLRYQEGKNWYTRVNMTGRLLLLCILLIWLASLWGMSFPFLTNITSVFFDTSVILALSILLWQFISNWIERKIIESEPEDDGEEKEDDEWGGAAARGRSYTLLPMIRKFIGSILVIMVTLTILSSMGVDIGPLLAGAGVVGLAIGFGAQKLVADMFSGFFYLLDDAFRVGEYLEAGSVSGAVETITLRNVMLRHHRGMLQIVPHSELGAITNFMRGGIVVKFNLDFPYDADIDKIRKVIKKVGQAMLQDEEFGDDFLKPVKSQGVREISNSVMTIRVKFTAQPGSHFVIRREAFKRITEALQAQGIHYAHRKVIVDLPEPSSENVSDEQIKAAGAAALRAAEETDKKTEPQQTKPGADFL